MKLILFEDEHLLVINKPAGVNTHAPGPFANEGIYEFLRHRAPDYANLAILHRLDKETSGVLVFGKTALANKSLHDQFAGRGVRKTYWLLAQGKTPEARLDVRSALVRAGAKYLSRPPHAGAEFAETRFRPLTSQEVLAADLPAAGRGQRWLAAEPLTGRTHQIRVQAAHSGFPIVGDVLYGGAPADRLFLHAAELRFRHPADQRELVFRAEFPARPSEALRVAIVDPQETNAFRVVHGASDGFPGWYVERFGDWLLSTSEEAPSPAQQEWLAAYGKQWGLRGAYHKLHSRTVRRSQPETASPRPLWGEPAPDRFEVCENGLRFELSFQEGYSVGIFLDQRENRRRLLGHHVAAGFPLELRGREVLNTFAYTCAFSVAAAKAGARVTSLDLSRKYLDWGRRNFALNDLDPAQHDFIYGDVFDWLRRLGKKGRRFEVLILDPPTFSQSKESGVFRVQKDYAKLVEAAAGLLAPNGVLLASSNAADWAPEAFLEAVTNGLANAGRTIQRQHYAPQPLDFPVSPAEPAYLKTVWLQL